MVCRVSVGGAGGVSCFVMRCPFRSV